MKKTVKVLLALTLVLVMVFAVACNSGMGDSTDDNGGNGTTPPTPPDGGNGNPPTPPDGNGGNGGNGGNNGGGTVFVASAIGMVETPASNSAQYVISYAQSANIAAGTTIKLVDASGNTMVEVTTVKACQSVIISSAALQNGETYTLYAGTGQLAQVTISSTITSAGTSQGGPGGGGQGGQPGGPGGRGGR